MEIEWLSYPGSNIVNPSVRRHLGKSWFQYVARQQGRPPWLSQPHGGTSMAPTTQGRATDYCQRSKTSPLHGGKRHEGTNATEAQGHGLLPREQERHGGTNATEAQGRGLLPMGAQHWRTTTASTASDGHTLQIADSALQFWSGMENSSSNKDKK
jgi:hypothetical protein